MIRYLETEEKGRCLELWREAFPEDSTEFCDYYFKEKMKDNKVLVRDCIHAPPEPVQDLYAGK